MNKLLQDREDWKRRAEAAADDILDLVGAARDLIAAIDDERGTGDPGLIRTYKVRQEADVLANIVSRVRKIQNPDSGERDSG